MMRILLVGTAAGGGFPQWNCRTPTSLKAWAGAAEAPARSQSSIALSLDGRRWVLVNASPDLRSQILANRQLQPTQGLRHSPISDVILTGGDIDFVAGLLTLREGHRFNLRATAPTLAAVDANPIFRALPPDRVPRCEMALDQSFAIDFGAAGALHVEAFAVAGKVPLYLEGVGSLSGAPGTTVGLDITDGHRRLVFVPGCAEIDDVLRHRLAGADLLLFDGTLWQDDELIALGVSPKSGRRMGHVSMSGAHGTIARLADLPIGRRIFIHINTTNPTLVAGTPERAAANRSGWHIPTDGEELTL
ncbi:pyrroloquinoline quinone biosynthesis protein PqqB [Oleomonas cavernae]|nr:pyrroloquinoline quinone biosynthesis protein PqqB [Oleomonas cavernae]